LTDITRDYGLINLQPICLNQAARKETESLESAGFNENKLKTLVRDAESPEVRGLAQDRLDTIKKDWEKLNNAGFDKTKLNTLADDAKTPNVRGEISERLNVVNAGYGLSILTALARDAKTQAVQEEIRRRREIIAAEQKSYDAVKNDMPGLTEFVNKPCEACLVQNDAQQILTAARQVKQADDTIRNSDLLGEIRRRLYELNFDPDRSDGQGNDLRQAIHGFEKEAKMAETGQPTAELLQRLRAAPAPPRSMLSFLGK
jgi:hypothetical protein